jgi:hypothetical protein
MIHPVVRGVGVEYFAGVLSIEGWATEAFMPLPRN